MQKTKWGVALVAIVLAAVMATVCALSNPVRRSAFTVWADEELEEEPSKISQLKEGFFSILYDYSLTPELSEEEPTEETEYEDPLFYGSFPAQEYDELMFDLPEGTPIGNTTDFECTFDMDELKFTLTFYNYDDTSSPLPGSSVLEGSTYTSEIEITADVTQFGGLDATFDLLECGFHNDIAQYCESTVVSLSEAYDWEFQFDDVGPASCSEMDTDGSTLSTQSVRGFFSTLFACIVIVIVVFIIVAETAEQIKSEKNRTDNRHYETNNIGMNPGNYIERQTQWHKAGHNSRYYHFGFAFFGDVGCGPAAVYNLMTALHAEGRIDYEVILSDVIYDFEKTFIEFSIGFGNLGSDPYEFGRYLRSKQISYKKYVAPFTSYASFQSTVHRYGTCYAIISRWNGTPLASTGHNFFVEKLDLDDGDKMYKVYNLYLNEMYYNELTSLNGLDKGGFIAGYIVE